MKTETKTPKTETAPLFAQTSRKAVAVRTAVRIGAAEQRNKADEEARK